MRCDCWLQVATLTLDAGGATHKHTPNRAAIGISGSRQTIFAAEVDDSLAVAPAAGGGGLRDHGEAIEVRLEWAGNGVGGGRCDWCDWCVWCNFTEATGAASNQH